MKNERRTPVVMIGYSRVATLARSLTCLSKCESVGERPLLLYLDAPYREEDRQDCERMYLAACDIRATILPGLQVIRREKNYGVPGNLLAAVRENLDQYGSVIFFEDDVCVSRTFLTYMDQALSFYENDNRIFCINGYKSPYISVPRSYPYDIYLTPRNMAWGFGVWKDRWDRVDFAMSDWDEFKSDNGKLNSLRGAGCDLESLIESQLSGRVHTWDVQCTYHMVKNGLYAIEPRWSMTRNIGFGVGGLHCSRRIAAFSRQRFYDFHPMLLRDIKTDESLLKQIRFSHNDPRLYSRLIRKLKRIWWGLGPSLDNPLNVP